MLSLAEQAVDLSSEQPFALEPARDVSGALEQILVAPEPDETQIGVPRLARPQELTLAADLEIAFGELEPVRRRDQGFETTACSLCELLWSPRYEEAVRLLCATTDAPAELV